MTKAQIMKRAWEIKKEDSRYIFGLCLKMAWAEAKAESKENKLMENIEKYGSRWTKYGKDRYYFNAEEIKEILGLEVSYYKSRFISKASINGEEISHAKAGRYLSVKLYFDLLDNEFHFSGSEYEANDIINALKAA